MYSRVLHMLRNGVVHDRAVAADRVKFNFFGISNEFGDDDGVVRADVRGVAQERREFRIRSCDLHGRATEYE